jgi:hypothetical protein
VKIMIQQPKLTRRRRPIPLMNSSQHPSCASSCGTCSWPGGMWVQQGWAYIRSSLNKLWGIMCMNSPKVRAHVNRVENGRKKSRPDPYRFLHLTRPFSYLRKNMETGRKRERAYSVRFFGIPFFSDWTRIYSVFDKYGMSLICISI